MNRTLTVLVCIMVAGVVVGASLPIFDSLTASSESVHNEGAGWVRFALDRNAGTTYSLSYTSDDDGFYIDNGTDRQTYDDSSTVNFDTILYADSNLSVWVDGAIHILGTNEGNPVYLEGNDAITIVRDAEGVTISSEGTDLASFGVPTWAYIPVSTGNYGFFYAADFDSDLGNGVKNYPSDMPLAVVGGGNVGVYAYNDIYRYNGLGLYMHPVYDDDGLFYGAYWDTTAPVEIESDDLNIIDPFNPDDIVFDPIDLDPIDLDPGMEIMAIPTPTYTEGDWGYDIRTIDDVDYAIIVSYSGTGGDIVVPATIGGYNVYRIGKSTTSGSSNVMDNTQLSANSTLTLPEGLVEIGKNAFTECRNLTGNLVIPSTVKAIYGKAFYQCQFSGPLILPDGIESIGNNAFGSAAAYQPLYTTIVIPSSVTSIDEFAFAYNKASELIIASDAVSSGTYTFAEQQYNNRVVLDLSSTVDYSVTRYGMNVDDVIYDNIGDCFGFISVVDYTIPAADGGAVSTLIAILPLVMVVGLVLVAIGMVVWNRIM